jgi:hypothetical protein
MPDKTWGTIGREITTSLGNLTEAEIKVLAEKTISEIMSRELSSESRNKALKLISREIMKVYPRLDSYAPCYWHDAYGKANLLKWRHLIFKYLTFGRNEVQPASEAPEIEEKIEIVETKLENITIQQLDLDTETQATLEAALNHSGMLLEDFIKQAIKVYAKTITGRNKAASDDLSAVPTGELLTESKFNTHPGRAVELTKRVIRAIHIYNTEVATEPSDRWMITASAIASIIGSRQSTIKEIMQQFQTSIDENNLNPVWNLTPYSNRKPGKKIDEIIKLTELVPDGLG